MSYTYYICSTLSHRYNNVLSDLQIDIVEHLCFTEKADYDTLQKKTGRSRITLIQSIGSLTKNGYIETQKLNPQREKSKLTFKLTDKGKRYAWVNMGLDAEDVLSTIENQAVNDYIELLKELPRVHRTYMFGSLALEFLQNNGWDEDDKQHKDTLKRSFYGGVMESIGDMEYDARNLFTPKIKNWLQQTYSSEGLKVFREELCLTRNNLNSTIEEFPP